MSSVDTHPAKCVERIYNLHSFTIHNHNQSYIAGPASTVRFRAPTAQPTPIVLACNLQARQNRLCWVRHRCPFLARISTSSGIIRNYAESTGDSWVIRQLLGSLEGGPFGMFNCTLYNRTSAGQRYDRTELASFALKWYA